MLLTFETTISAIVGYAASLPEPVDVLVFGIIIASVAFVLRNKAAKSQTESEV